MASREVGVRGKHICFEACEIIYHVAKFMQRESDCGLKYPVTDYRKRVLAATRICESSYQKILKEGVRNENSSTTSLSSPPNKRRRKEPVFDKITPELIKELRWIIYDLHVIQKTRPTPRRIYETMQNNDVLFEGNITSLNKLVKRIGYRWRKTTNNKRALAEKHSIHRKRLQFLGKINKYRTENKTIIYIGETFLYPTHTQSEEESENNKDEDEKQNSKRRRLVIVHAGGEGGFVPNAQLIFKSGSKSGDYQGDMNHENFMKWVTTQLIPNLPEKSVVVVDNSSYHNVTVQNKVNSTSPKADMIQWLTNHRIQFLKKSMKPELYQKIKENKYRFPPEYKLDAVIEQHGHTVLRLPPHHPDLNPIENIWTIVKDWVAENNVTFSLSEVEELTRNELEAIGPDIWKKICKQVKIYEGILKEREEIFEEVTDELRLFSDTESSDETDESDVDTD